MCQKEPRNPEVKFFEGTVYFETIVYTTRRENEWTEKNILIDGTGTTTHHGKVGMSPTISNILRPFMKESQDDYKIKEEDSIRVRNPFYELKKIPNNDTQILM